MQLAAGKSLTGSTQVIGPVLCRKSLLRSGEANSADAPPAEGAAGNEVEDAHAVEMKKKTLVLPGAAGGGAGGGWESEEATPKYAKAKQASFPPPARAWSHIAAMYPVRLFAGGSGGHGSPRADSGEGGGEEEKRGARSSAVGLSMSWSSLYHRIFASRAEAPGAALAGWAGENHDRHAAGGGGEGVGAGVVGLPFGGGGKEVHHSTLTESINQSIAVMQSHFSAGLAKKESLA